jgi:hypothetical protein
MMEALADQTLDRVCPACQEPFDWKPVLVNGQEFCCAACSRGLSCTCPEHSENHNARPLGSRAGSQILGATEGEL